MHKRYILQGSGQAAGQVQHLRTCTRVHVSRHVPCMEHHAVVICMDTYARHQHDTKHSHQVSLLTPRRVPRTMSQMEVRRDQGCPVAWSSNMRRVTDVT